MAETIKLEKDLVVSIVNKLKQMNKFHGEPVAWYAGHFVKHLTKKIIDSDLASKYSSNIKLERYYNRPFIG